MTESYQHTTWRMAMHALKSFFKVFIKANLQQGKGKGDGQAVFNKQIRVGFSSFKCLVLK